jgi:hypothetical protein
VLPLNPGPGTKVPETNPEEVEMKGNRIAVIVGVIIVVAVVGFLALRGHYPPKDGTEGTIGAAQRYTAQQISGQDVTLQSPEVQAFLQSDTFHQLATNPEFRQCVTDAAFGKALENKSFVAMLKTADAAVVKAEAIRNAVSDGAFAGKTPDQLQVLFGADMLKMLENKSFVDALRTDALKTEALKTTDALKIEALVAQHPDWKFANTEAFKTLEANRVFTDMLRTGDMKKIVDNQKLVDFLKTPDFAKVQAPELAMVLSDQAVQSVLVSDAFRTLSDQKVFTDALTSKGFDQFVRTGDMAKAITGDEARFSTETGGKLRVKR